MINWFKNWVVCIYIKKIFEVCIIRKDTCIIFLNRLDELSHLLVVLELKQVKWNQLNQGFIWIGTDDDLGWLMGHPSSWLYIVLTSSSQPILFLVNKAVVLKLSDQWPCQRYISQYRQRMQAQFAGFCPIPIPKSLRACLVHEEWTQKVLQYLSH
jgi:hypothetical protein